MASLTVIFSATLSIVFDTNAASLQVSNNAMRLRGTGLQSGALLFMLVWRSNVETRYWCLFVVIYAEFLTVVLR